MIKTLNFKLHHHCLNSLFSSLLLKLLFEQILFLPLFQSLFFFDLLFEPLFIPLFLLHLDLFIVLYRVSVTVMLQRVSEESIYVYNVLFESPSSVTFTFKLFLVHVPELFQCNRAYCMQTYKHCYCNKLDGFRKMIH